VYVTRSSRAGRISSFLPLESGTEMTRERDGERVLRDETRDLERVEPR